MLLLTQRTRITLLQLEGTNDNVSHDSACAFQTLCAYRPQDVVSVSWSRPYVHHFVLLLFKIMGEVLAKGTSPVKDSCS
jgi:hypothetical protein